jgi:hypothetical protein
MRAELFALVTEEIAKLHEADGPSPWTLETDESEFTIRLRRGDQKAIVADCKGVTIPPHVTPFAVAFETYTKLRAFR